MSLLTFKGGVHPNDGKALAKDKAIVQVQPKGDLVYPMSQHIGAPAPPVVEKVIKCSLDKKLVKLADLFQQISAAQFLEL